MLSVVNGLIAEVLFIVFFICNPACNMLNIVENDA